ncbi:MAG: hypothetical protein PF795_10190 [Kiritimatiellae bacterium]|jgi:endonuclease/exonuclease/phosphatase family metal-dependent hydrolase|nr:hypothetical protein [Kiritimatiellia bacterium]
MRTFVPKKWFKRVLVPLLILITAGASLRHRDARRYSPTDLRSDQLRIITWNVGYFAVSTNKNLRDADLNELTRILTRATPDVVVLQEVGTFEQSERLADALNKTLRGSIHGCWRAYNLHTGHHGQVLSILTRLPHRETIEIEAGGRGILGLSLRHPSGTYLFVAGVHAPHPARGFSETRENIVEALELISIRTESLRIFAGDLNNQFDPQDPSGLHAEISATMTDSTIALGDTYYAGTRIDHAFHYPQDLDVDIDASGMMDLSPRIADVPGFRDHRPIVLTYTLP